MTDINFLGCGDGQCIIRTPSGMHTNGGCVCRKGLSRLTWDERLRIITALDVYRAEVARLSAEVARLEDVLEWERAK